MLSTTEKPLRILSDNKKFIGAIFEDTKNNRDLVIKADSTEREVMGWVSTVALITAKKEYIQTFKNRVSLLKRLLLNHAKIKPFILNHIKDIEETIEARIEERRKCDKDTIAWGYLETMVDHYVWYKEELKKCLIVVKTIKDNPMITDDDIDRAKEYPIDQLIDFVGGFAPCIFHNEKTGSMKFYPSTNSTYCFGCHKAADAITIYRTLNNCDFRTAVRNLLK